MCKTDLGFMGLCGAILKGRGEEKFDNLKRLSQAWPKKIVQERV